MALALSSDFEAARAALYEQAKASSCYLVLQLDKTVGDQLQVVSSGKGLQSLALSEQDVSFVLYKQPEQKNPFLLFYRGRAVPPHINSAVLTRFAAIVKLLEPFEHNFFEIPWDGVEELTEDEMEQYARRGKMD